MRTRIVSTVVYASMAAGSVALVGAFIANTTATTVTAVTAKAPCAKVVSLDEFARPAGASEANLCVLASGRSIRIVTVSSQRAFSGYVTARPELEVAWDYPVAAIGTEAALRDAGLQPTMGEEG